MEVGNGVTDLVCDVQTGDTLRSVDNIPTHVRRHPCKVRCVLEHGRGKEGVVDVDRKVVMDRTRPNVFGLATTTVRVNEHQTFACFAKAASS